MGKPRFGRRSQDGAPERVLRDGGDEDDDEFRTAAEADAEPEPAADPWAEVAPDEPDAEAEPVAAETDKEPEADTGEQAAVVSLVREAEVEPRAVPASFWRRKWQPPEAEAQSDAELEAEPEPSDEQPLVGERSSGSGAVAVRTARGHVRLLRTPPAGDCRRPTLLVERRRAPTRRARP